ncbi:hypothetical protein ACIBL8_48360 [Streptomyces sp. NPDC050523]|uniref:hypothetical protein n=1 Tax=Streptomyces sp. NPDC050523 TaxID=3365622 RepID=UPI0037B42379
MIDRHPGEVLQMLRHGEIDIALMFRYAHAPLVDEGCRMVHVADDSIHLVSRQPDDSIANHRHSAWIGGCERCQGELTAAAGLMVSPHASSPSVTTWSSSRPSLPSASVSPPSPASPSASTASPDVHTTDVPGFPRQIYTVTYGDPPDPQPPRR